MAHGASNDDGGVVGDMQSRISQEVAGQVMPIYYVHVVHVYDTFYLVVAGRKAIYATIHQHLWTY